MKVTRKVLSAAELHAKFRFPLGQTWLPDVSYAVPTSQAIFWFGAQFEKLLKDCGLQKWRRNWDCDNFATLFYAFAQAQWSLHSADDSAEALAIGEFWYRRTDNTGHAINIAVVDDDEHLIFFEPQSQEIVKLTDQEVLSSFYRRF